MDGKISETCICKGKATTKFASGFIDAKLPYALPLRHFWLDEHRDIHHRACDSIKLNFM